MKNVALVKISDPAAVAQELQKTGDEYTDGGIFVEIPEMGFVGAENYIYCEYGLSIPYYRVNIDDEVLVEPIVGDDEQYFYTGLVGCGRPAIAPTTDDQLKIITDDGVMTLTIGVFTVIIDSSVPIMKIGSSGAAESFVLGDTLKTELQKNVDALTQLQTDFSSWTPAPNDGGLALKTILSSGFLTEIIASLANILSVKIAGE